MPPTVVVSVERRDREAGEGFGRLEPAEQVARGPSADSETHRGAHNPGGPALARRGQRGEPL